MSKLGFSIALISALALGCGGSSTDESTDEGTSGDEVAHDQYEHHEGHEEAYAQMSPEIQAFHDGIAEHWHGDRSGSAVCPDAANLQTLAATAADSHTEHPAEGDEARAAAQAVVDACATGTDGGADFDAAFDRLHNALHGMMHDPHTDHGEHGEGEPAEG